MRTRIVNFDAVAVAVVRTGGGRGLFVQARRCRRGWPTVGSRRVRPALLADKRRSRNQQKVPITEPSARR